MSEFGKKLKQANALWASARKRASESGSRGYTEFEDGRYMARLVDGKISESQSSGRTQIMWTWRFEEGEYEGQDKLDFSGLETELNLEYLAKRLVQLGYEPPESLDEIEDILEDVKKTRPLCKIRLKTKGEFQNVFIDRVFASGMEEDGTETTTSAPTDEDEVEESPEESEEVEEEPEEVEEEVEEEIEEEVEEEEEEAVELSVGMNVIVSTSKGDAPGEVLEIIEKEGKVRVKMNDGKVIRVGVDKLAIDETVPEEPKAKTKKSRK